MSSLLEIIFSVFGYVIAGYVVKKINIIPSTVIKWFDFISFNIVLPIALFTYFWKIQFPNINAFELLFSFFGTGVLIFLLGFFISSKFLHYKPDDRALFGLGACYGNLVALGIPLMYSILGPINAMPYMILVFLHGFIHFTYTTVIIEAYRNKNNSYVFMIFKTLFGLCKNIVLFGMFLGFILNYSEIKTPIFLSNLLDPLSKFALPAILVSLGFALANFKIQEHFNLALILTFLKNFLHPLCAFILSQYIFEMQPMLVFIVTMAAALPSGAQTYYFSYRYKSLQNIISANVVISSFVSFFTISFLLLIFDY